MYAYERVNQGLPMTGVVEVIATAAIGKIIDDLELFTTPQIIILHYLLPPPQPQVLGEAVAAVVVEMSPPRQLRHFLLPIMRQGFL